MITLDEALRLGRAYGISSPSDVFALRDGAADFAEAKHIAIQLGGTDAERSSEAFDLEREQRNAEAAVENKAFKAYREANPKPRKPPRIEAQPQLRDGMTDRERMQAIDAAHVLNVKAATAEKHDEVQQQSRDWYDWAAAGKPEK